MTHSQNAAVALLKPNLELRGDRTAIIAGDRSVSYKMLDLQSSRFASLLRGRGVSPGERVAIVAGDSPEYIFALLGCLKLGTPPVLLNTSLFEEDYEYILNDCGAVFLITEKESAALAARSSDLRGTILLDEGCFPDELAAASVDIIPHAPTVEEIAFILYSSGSTGSPKGVPHRHGDMIVSADAFAGKVLGMNEQDVVFSASKLPFAYGLGNSFSFPLRFGATVVLFPGKPESADIIRCIEGNGVTLFFGVPIAYNMLLKTMGNGARLSSLRLCISAGEPLPAPLYREWKKATAVELLDGIGSTEALHIYISNRPETALPGTAGSIIPPFEARIVDEAGLPVPPATPGRLQLRGPCITPCYWNNPEKTARSMLADGWLETGDIFVEERGCFTFQGRVDDLFKVDAHWVSPVRVESVLQEHPGVMECAVGQRSVEHLTRPIAFVVVNRGHEPGPSLERELRRFCLRKLPPYMCPVQIEFLEELPKTATGKILRARLKRAGLLGGNNGESD
jgi:benzoate-CoA ligase